MRRIACPVLLININTVHEFPSDEADMLAAIPKCIRPGQANVHTVTSPWVHQGCLREQRIPANICPLGSLHSAKFGMTPRGNCLQASMLEFSALQ
jgi:hypothetical protein